MLLLAGGVFAYFYFIGGSATEDIQLTRARWIEMLVDADTPEALVSAAANDVFDGIFPDVDESTQGYVAINLAAGFGWLDAELEEGSFEPAAAATRDFVAGTALLALGYVFIDGDVEIADIGGVEEDERYFIELAVLAGVLDLDEQKRANPYGPAEPEYAQSVAGLVKERRESFVRPDDFENVVTLTDATLDLSAGYQSGEIRPFDEDEFIFETTPAIASQLSVGGVFIVSLTDNIVFDGIARKVTGITHDGGIARITTEIPEFEEVFDELSIWEELDLSGIEVADDLDDDLADASLSSYRESSIIPLSASVDRLSGVSGGGSSEGESRGGRSEHPFYLRVDVGHVKFKVDYKKGEREYTIRFESEIRVNLGIEFDDKVKGYKAKDGKLFPTAILPTAIVGSAVKISWPFDVSLEGKGTVSQTHTIKLKFAIDMRSYIIPSGVSDKDYQRSAGNVQANGSLKGAAKAGIGLSPVFLGFELVQLQFMMGAEISISARQSVNEGFCADIRWALFAEAKIQYLKGLTSPLNDLHKKLEQAADKWNTGGWAITRIAKRFVSNTMVKNLSNHLKRLEKTLTAGPYTYQLLSHRIHWEGESPLDVFYPEMGYYPAAHDARGKPTAFCTSEAVIRLISPAELNLKKNPSEPAVIDIDYFGRGNYVRAVYEEDYTLRALATEILTVSGNVLSGVQKGGGSVEARLFIMRDLIEYEKLLKVGYEGWDILGNRDQAAYERAIALAGEPVATIRTQTFGVPVTDEEEEETPSPSSPTPDAPPPDPTPDEPTPPPPTSGEHPVLLSIRYEIVQPDDPWAGLQLHRIMTIRNDSPYVVICGVIVATSPGGRTDKYDDFGNPQNVHPGRSQSTDRVNIQPGQTVEVREYDTPAYIENRFNDRLAATGYFIHTYWIEGTEINQREFDYPDGGIIIPTEERHLVDPTP